MTTETFVAVGVEKSDEYIEGIYCLRFDTPCADIRLPGTLEELQMILTEAQLQLDMAKAKHNA